MGRCPGPPLRRAGEPAAPVADLVENRNILRCTGKLDNQSAVSQWNMLGQQPGVGDDYTTRTAQGQVTDPKAPANTQQVEHMPHPGDSDDAATYGPLIAARAGWQTGEIDVTVVGWFKADGTLWQPTANVTLYSPLALPIAPYKMTLGVQEVTWSQNDTDQGEGTTTTLRLVLPQFLAPFGTSGTQLGLDGNVVSNPGQGTPVAPDTGS